MPAIEEMKETTSTLVLPALPIRETKTTNNERKLSRVALEAKLSLLLRLVERVKSLDQVSVKNVPYLTRSGMVVNVPGPFSIRFPASSPAIVTPEGLEQKVADEVEEDEAEDDLPDEEELEGPEIQEEDLIRSLSIDSQLSRQKFVVRNEFGHVRIQHLLEAIENSTFGTISPPQTNSHHHHSRNHSPSSSFSNLPSLQQPQGVDIGGHCVLPKEAFDLCLERGWGTPHVLAGRYHPIADSIIPETTLMFYAPRTEEELEIVWNIVFQSYEWAFSDAKQMKV